MRTWSVLGTFVLFVVMIVVTIIDLVPGQIEFLAVSVPLVRVATSGSQDNSVECLSSTPLQAKEIPLRQQVLIALTLTRINCLDFALSNIPTDRRYANRNDLISFQVGLAEWLKGNKERAIEHWRRVSGINAWLYHQGDQVLGSDPIMAAEWYQTAMLVSQSIPDMADAIVIYTERLRGRIPIPVQIDRLSDFEKHFLPEAPLRLRLMSLRQQMTGDHTGAYQSLQQAIYLGLDDAETWYLLGDSARALGDQTQAEQAYREALEASIQIPSRRPWHLYRFAALLESTGRPSEALPFLEEAVRLSDYYLYSDNLAVLYAELGQPARAPELCAEARRRAGSTHETLRCEAP